MLVTRRLNRTLNEVRIQYAGNNNNTGPTRMQVHEQVPWLSANVERYLPPNPPKRQPPKRSSS